MIIDFHTHTFPAKISASVLDNLSKECHCLPKTDGSVDSLLRSMREADITYSVNLPVMTYAEQTEKVNTSVIRNLESMREKGIISFGGIHPDFVNYREELHRLAEAGVKGIKLHPAYQGVPIDDLRYLRIADCASELGLIIVTHAGLDVGFPGCYHCDVRKLRNLMDAVQPEKFVLAHMGGWGQWEQVLDILAGDPVWFDTAFSVGKVTPNPKYPGEPMLSYTLSDEEFVRLVRAHGAHHILFGTDSPWEDQSDYVDRVAASGLTEEELDMLFWDNPAELLGLC